LLILALFTASFALTFNRSFFYRTSSFWGEPRFTHPSLSTLDIQILGGSNHRARNGDGTRVNLTSLYGSENCIALNQASPTTPLVLPDSPTHISFRAVADLFETDFNFYQNLSDGWFFHLHVPLLVFRICPSGFIEDSKTVLRSSSNYEPAWEHPLTLMTPFLNEHSLKTNGSNDVGLSDSTLFIGWSYSYEDTTYFDFIDTTLKTGVLFPTGKKADIDELFSIPYGYNGYWGIPFSGDMSVGAYDWLTLGAHLDAVFFIPREQCLRLRTAKESPQGLIVLEKGMARVGEGIVWRAGLYTKADHICNGLSLLAGFTYEQQNKDSVCPKDTILFPKSLTHNDERFEKWARSIFHALIEYDFTREDATTGARFSVFVDIELSGLRTFNINTSGGYLGVDCTWSF